MKKNISLLLVSFCLVVQSQTTPVLFTMQSLTGQANNRAILVQPDRTPSTPLWYGTNLVPVADFTLQPVAGQVVTNLTPWGYTIRVDGWPRSVHIVVPASSNTLNAVNLINTNAFSPLQLIQTFITTNTAILAGTNVLLVTNMDGSITINSTATGGGAASGTATNLDQNATNQVLTLALSQAQSVAATNVPTGISGPLNANQIIFGSGYSGFNFWLGTPYIFFPDGHAIMENPLTTNNPSGSVPISLLPSIVVTNFCTFQFASFGDSLTTTNPSASVSFPQFMTSNFGWALTTNTAVGGIPSITVYNNILLAQPWWPVTTGTRTLATLCMGKNDMYGMALSASNTTASSVLTGYTNTLARLQAAGFETVIITQPYTPGSIYGAFANAEPCRKLINATLLTMTNYPGVVAVVNYDLVAPPNTWTNSSGGVNTNTTLDGLHPTNAINLLLAGAIHSNVMASAFKTQAAHIAPSSTWTLAGTNGPGSSIWSASGGNETWTIGDPSGSSTIENSFAGDTGLAFWNLGLGIFSPRDFNNVNGPWCVNVFNHSGTRAIELDPNDNSIFIGPTNSAAGNEGFHRAGLNVRGVLDLMGVNQTDYPGTVPATEWVIETVANGGNALHFLNPFGDFSFGSGGTITATNFSALGQINGNAGGLSNVLTTSLVGTINATILVGSITNLIGGNAAGLTNATTMAGLGPNSLPGSNTVATMIATLAPTTPSGMLTNTPTAAATLIVTNAGSIGGVGFTNKTVTGNSTGLVPPGTFQVYQVGTNCIIDLQNYTNTHPIQLRLYSTNTVNLAWVTNAPDGETFILDIWQGVGATNGLTFGLTNPPNTALWITNGFTGYLNLPTNSVASHIKLGVTIDKTTNATVVGFVTIPM